MADIPVQCWTPSMCESKKVSTNNQTTTVSFDKINTPEFAKSCKCVKEKK